MPGARGEQRAGERPAVCLTGRNPPGPLFSPYLVLAVCCTGVFVAALDQYVIVTALPSMMLDLRLQVTELDRAAWIIIGYFLGYTAIMPLIGRVSDAYGHRRLYFLSLAIFMAGSALVALSPNLPWMVGARVFQAIGGGAVVPITMAIAAGLFPEGKRALPLGIVGACAEAGSVLGPLYGGLISEQWGWQWIFWLNLPIGFLVALLLLLRPWPSARVSARMDLAGAFFLTAMLVLLTAGLSQGLGGGRSSLYFAALLAVALVFLGLFLSRERRAREPVIDLGMFRSATFSSANGTNLLVGSALVIALVNVPLMSDTILGASPLEGGLRLMRFTAMLPVGAIIGGVLCRQLGYRLPTALGLVLAGAGFLFMSRWGLDIADPSMTVHLMISGLGFGLVIAPVSTAVIDSVREGQRATAASLVTLMRMVGMMVGLSALSSWGMSHFQALTAGIPLQEMASNPERLKGSALTLFHDFFLVAAALCGLALLVALGMRSGRRSDSAKASKGG